MLKLNKISFSFKNVYVLQEKRMEGKKVGVKAITMYPDFEKVHNGVKYVFDTKGHSTESSKLKFKMLDNLLSKEGKPYKVVILRKPKEVVEFIKKFM